MRTRISYHLDFNLNAIPASNAVSAGVACIAAGLPALSGRPDDGEGAEQQVEAIAAGLTVLVEDNQRSKESERDAENAALSLKRRRIAARRIRNAPHTATDE